MKNDAAAERTVSAFADDRLIARGPLLSTLRATRERLDLGETGRVLFFDDDSGAQLDFDLRGTPDDVVAREAPPPATPKVGRPKLGVVAREISLLPEHWAWLEQQPSGASAALRRLVDEAKKKEPQKERRRRRRDAVGRVMTVLCGHQPGFEEALRALYRDDAAAFTDLTASWPSSVRDHLRTLLEEVWWA